ncbi:MAG: glycosyltransferase family 2 protein [Anaerolineae bacterium]|jgi:glycosyltransferase involved in cell wall biosynthesis
MSVIISAIVATHNRASYLTRSVGSLVGQTLPRDQYEVVVVDNGSTDDTRKVIEGLAGSADIRYVYEPQLGASRARNTGFRVCRGRYLAFLDSDAVAGPNWLEGYLETFERFSPRPGMIGGRCEPIWEAPRPEWLSDHLLGAHSILHWSDEPTVIGPDKWLSLCNMAVPREVFERAGGFREDVGRRGGRLMANEEIYLRQQVDSWGLPVVYHPGLSVGHHISASRLTKPWFRRHAFWQGWSDAVMMDGGQAGAMPASERARLAAARLLWALPRAPLAVLSPGSAARFRRQYQVIEAAGYVAGLVRGAAA